MNRILLHNPNSNTINTKKLFLPPPHWIFSCQEKKEASFLFTLQVEEPNLEQEYSIRTSSSFDAEKLTLLRSMKAIISVQKLKLKGQKRLHY